MGDTAASLLMDCAMVFSDAIFSWLALSRAWTEEALGAEKPAVKDGMLAIPS